MKKSSSKKFIFIDTNIFINAVTSDDGKQILEKIISLLNSKKLELVLPEVIKVEIVSEYAYWKNDILKKIEENLSTDSILGIKNITEQTAKKNRRGETEAKKIDIIISNDRKKMLENIKLHYKSVSTDIDTICNHKNTNIIELIDILLLAGMKRSLLKKAPYTRTDKSKENAHTKDIDCIAFESLKSFLNKQKTTDELVMCVSDIDYVEKGKLHKDIIDDMGNLKCKCYDSLLNMLKSEFKIKIGDKKSQKNIENDKDSITLSPQTGVVESSSSF